MGLFCPFLDCSFCFNFAFPCWVDSLGGLEDSPGTISLNAELLG